MLIAANISRAKVFMRNESNTQGLKAQFLATEDPLKMMKNFIYFILKALFSLEIFTFFFICHQPYETHLDVKNRLPNQQVLHRTSPKELVRVMVL